MTRVLVTGAAGFVGKAVVQELLRMSGIEVVATCRGSGDSIQALAPKDGRLTIIPGVDLGEADNLERIPPRLDYVLHVAALAKFEGASVSALKKANVDATKNLIQHIQRTSGATLRRFLFTSTIGVHDRPAFSDLNHPIEESSPCCPTSEYGRSKLAAENFIRESGIPYVIARLSWIYGPHMRIDSHIRVLGSMAHKGSAISKIPWPGRFTAGFIEDVAEALVGLLFKESLAGNVFLIGHPAPVSFRDLFALFHKMNGRPACALVPESWLKALGLAAQFFPMKLRSLFQDYYVCRVDRLGQEGLALKTSFAEGLKRSVEEGLWFKN